MLNHQTNELHSVALKMAEARYGNFIGNETATIFNALLAEWQRHAPDNASLQAMPRATKETKWGAFAGMTSQIKGISDYLTVK